MKQELDLTSYLFVTLMLILIAGLVAIVLVVAVLNPDPPAGNYGERVEETMRTCVQHHTSGMKVGNRVAVIVTEQRILDCLYDAGYSLAYNGDPIYQTRTAP